MLLESGPEIHPAALNASKAASSFVPFRSGFIQDQYAAELALAYQQLGTIHGRLNHQALQGHMLRQAVELLERLDTVNPATYRARLAALSMAEAKVHAAAGHNEEACKLGRRAIALAESLRHRDPENSAHKVTVAQMHTSFGHMLLHVLPPREVEQHHRTALELLAELHPEHSSAISNQTPERQKLADLLAECRVNLACCLESRDESKTLLQDALEHLMARDGQRTDWNDTNWNDDMEWRTSSLARAEFILGEVYSNLGPSDEAQRPLESSIQRCEELT